MDNRPSNIDRDNQLLSFTLLKMGNWTHRSGLECQSECEPSETHLQKNLKNLLAEAP
ncbi:hypothetical protein SDJN02_07926, partial [Cucurbita argyrosperma subsp. argyrosperma]